MNTNLRKFSLEQFFSMFLQKSFHLFICQSVFDAIYVLSRFASPLFMNFLKMQLISFTISDFFYM